MLRQGDLFNDQIIPNGIKRRFRLHKKENNDASQNMLQENKYRWNKQCDLVYKLLMEGKRLNSKTSPAEYDIVDLRARKRDLKKINKVKISERNLGGGLKEIYMSQEDKDYNRKQFGI